MKLKKSAVVLVALGLTMLAGPALATGSSYEVRVGGSSSPATQVPFTAESGEVDFHTATVNMECSYAEAEGYINKGSNVSDVAVIESTTWYDCVVPGGNATVTQVGDWTLHGTGAATAAQTNNIAGHIENVEANVATTPLPGICNFSVSGAPTGSFNESTQQLVVNQPLSPKGLEIDLGGGCLGDITDGEAAAFAATFDVTTTGGAVNLVQ